MHPVTKLQLPGLPGLPGKVLALDTKWRWTQTDHKRGRKGKKEGEKGEKVTSKRAVYTAFVVPSRPKNESVTDGPTNGGTDGPEMVRVILILIGREERQISTTSQKK